MWMRRSAWLHGLLAAYLWLIAWIPLGNWNRQNEGTLLQALASGRGVHADDFGILAFVTLPAVLFWLGYKFRSLWLVFLALILDVVWLVLQVQSWWIPYMLGTNGWQLAYSKGPTTKVLPSFRNHPAPDGMHSLIMVLLLFALLTGIAAVHQLRVERRNSSRDVSPADQRVRSSEENR